MNRHDVESILEQLYRWSRLQGYKGYNKHDGLNSPILRLLLGWGRWPRMIAIQGVMRFPLNLRPLLQVNKSYNPKGLALFVMGLLDWYQVSKDPVHLEEAEGILELLMEMHSPGEWSGECWGYHYPWQDPGFFAQTNTPNAVVTSFVCEAFLQAYRLTDKEEYLEQVSRVIPFFLNDLTRLKDEPEELCLGYMPLPMTMRVMDVSILIGSVLAQYGALRMSDEHKKVAERLVGYVVNQQTVEGAWFYTDPPGDSHIRHDNYHTGFILDALWRYMQASGNRKWLPNYEQGLTFYAERLFNEDGSPRWMSDRDFPHDIHGAAQGLLTFSRHSDRYGLLLDRIAHWSIDRMYHPDGRFYYQQGSLFTRRFTLLRWCNGWMARGLSAYLNVKVDK